MRALQTLIVLVASLGTTHAWIDFDPSLIPTVDGALPVLKRGPHATFPTDVLNEILLEGGNNVTLQTNETMGPGLWAFDGDRLVAYIDSDTGQAELFPDLTTIQPTPLNASNVLSVPGQGDGRVWQLLGLEDTFPIDGTNVTVVTGASVLGNTVERPINSTQTTSTNVGEPDVYWTHGVVERTIPSGGKQHPICGGSSNGTLASFGFTQSGSIVSLSYQWRTATPLDNVTAIPAATNTVVDAIIKQLEPLCLDVDKSGKSKRKNDKYVKIDAVKNKGKFIKVEGVDLCFYEGNEYVQPVYRFYGSLNAEHPKSKRNNNHGSTVPTGFVGYVPIGSGSLEAIPPLEEDVEPSESPSASAPQAKRSILGLSVPNYFQTRRSGVERRGVRPEVRVGRYVVRNDIKQWVTSAKNFWSNLQDSKAVADFTNDQYYWAEPRFYTNQKNTFVNSVDIAFSEAHGSYHLFTTDSNCCDRVNIDPDFPNTDAAGYGTRARRLALGSDATPPRGLSYWIIHSCEIMPSPADYAPADRSKAFDPWWDVFNGLHAVLSYRTQMKIADNAAGATAKAIARGAPVVGAWLKAVNSDGKYKSGKTYFSSNANREQPYGRPAAIFVCGHENDRVWDRADLGKPSCLKMIWYNN